MAALKVCNLSVRRGGRTLVHNVSMQIAAHEIVAFLGPNGAGKTTFLRTIMGIYPTPSTCKQGIQNAVWLNGSLINALPTDRRVAAGMAYLPQHSTLFERLSVWDNLRIIFSYHPVWKNQSPDDFDVHAHHLLQRAGIDAVSQQLASTLSGGQRRKLEVVRTLLMRPAIVLFDEPFAGVDPKSMYELRSWFVDIAQSGVGVLISDHHVEQLLTIATRVYVLVEGRLVASGAVDAILNSSDTREAYFGNQFYHDMVERFGRT